MRIPNIRDEQEIAMKWLAVFGGEVPYDIMQEHVLGGGTMANHMWHVFTWGGVDCFVGNMARVMFNAMKYRGALGFFGGWSCGYGYKMDSLGLIGKVSAEVLDGKNGDCYIIGDKFAWTYVKTHDPDCGPYLCVKDKSADLFGVSTKNKNKIAQRWLEAFGKGMAEDVLKEYVLPTEEYSNSLCDICWYRSDIIKGEAAKTAFDELEYDKALIFFGGYAPSAVERKYSPNRTLFGGYIIENAAVIGKIPAKALEGIRGDIYMVGEKFSWFYVKTHEGDCLFYAKDPLKNNGDNYV